MLVFKQPARAGTDLGLNCFYFRVFSVSVKKTHGTCKQIERWYSSDWHVQGQTLNGMVCEKEFSTEKYTRAMEQREAATGLSKAREAADR